MKLLFIILLSSIYLHQSITIPLETRVVNGKNSTNLFYYACTVTMINLAEGTVRFGGGSIITEKHVLTTASLIAGKANDFRIDYRVSDSPYTRITYGEISVIHPNYNSNTYENDIAIIFCIGPFPAINRIPIGDAASVPANRLAPMNGVGYGITSSNGSEISHIPYYANLTSYSKGNCKLTAPTQFCAYTTRLERGEFCLGDEGVGLTSDKHLWNEMKTLTLIGMITRIDNPNCELNSEKTQFLSYTPVGYYEKWIKVLTGLVKSEDSLEQLNYE